MLAVRSSEAHEPGFSRPVIRSGTNEDVTQHIPLAYTSSNPAAAMRSGVNEDSSQIVPTGYGIPVNAAIPPPIFNATSGVFQGKSNRSPVPEKDFLPSQMMPAFASVAISEARSVPNVAIRSEDIASDILGTTPVSRKKVPSQYYSGPPPVTYVASMTASQRPREGEATVSAPGKAQTSASKNNGDASWRESEKGTRKGKAADSYLTPKSLREELDTYDGKNAVSSGSFSGVADVKNSGHSSGSNSGSMSKSGTMAKSGSGSMQRSSSNRAKDAAGTSRRRGTDPPPTAVDNNPGAGGGFVIPRRRSSDNSDEGYAVKAVEDDGCSLSGSDRASTGRASMDISECRRFSPEQLAKATNQYDECRLLGKGAFGFVFRGDLVGCQVAVKKLEGGGWQGPEEYRMEVEVLSRMRHPHIVLLMGHCPEDMSLVYEYLPGGSLQDYLSRSAGRKPLPWSARVRIASEVASALNYLHHNDPPIAHRDLKPENILLDKNMMSKVGDVGLARLLEEEGTMTMRVRGTVGYIDPEEVITCEVSVLSDVYALGLIMLQLLMGEASVKAVQQMMCKFMVSGSRNLQRAVEVVVGNMDLSGGRWPQEIAVNFAALALRCADKQRRHRPDLRDEVQPMLKMLMDAAVGEMSRRQEDADTQFLCPISKKKMKNPVLAADGFSYEKVNIEQWLTKSSKSPVTGEPLEHKFLTPNHALKMLLMAHH